MLNQIYNLYDPKYYFNLYDKIKDKNINKKIKNELNDCLKKEKKFELILKEIEINIENINNFNIIKVYFKFFKKIKKIVILFEKINYKNKNITFKFIKNIQFKNKIKKKFSLISLNKIYYNLNKVDNNIKKIIFFKKIYFFQKLKIKLIKNNKNNVINSKIKEYNNKIKNLIENNSYLEIRFINLNCINLKKLNKYFQKLFDIQVNNNKLKLEIKLSKFYLKNFINTTNKSLNNLGF